MAHNTVQCKDSVIRSKGMLRQEKSQEGRLSIRHELGAVLGIMTALPRSGISVAVQPGRSDLSLIGQAYQCRCSLVWHVRGYVFGLYLCRRPSLKSPDLALKLS
jgi:hypothetical protein